MTLDELRKRLSGLTITMEGAVDNIVLSAADAQQIIYEYLLEQINFFEISNGAFVANQDYRQRLAIITKQVNSIINRKYKPSISEYLNTYKTIDETTSGLHKSYNELVIDKSLLTSARRAVYDQAEYYLVDGLADAYVQPAKYLLMQAATNGITIKQARSLLDNWNKGELVTGRLASGRPTPRLQAYAGQIARDSIFQYNGTIQDKIGQQYGLKKFIYVGGLVKDSRPLCKHLVGLRRKIELKEIPKLIEKYPQGVIPGTTEENFPIRRAGYNCIHTVMMVR